MDLNNLTRAIKAAIFSVDVETLSCALTAIESSLDLLDPQRSPTAPNPLRPIYFLMCEALSQIETDEFDLDWFRGIVRGLKSTETCGWRPGAKQDSIDCITVAFLLVGKHCRSTIFDTITQYPKAHALFVEAFDTLDAEVADSLRDVDVTPRMVRR